MLDKQVMITAENALPGRSTPMTIDDTHFVNQTSMTAAPKEGEEHILIGMGCFWGVERLFWKLDGVVSTSVGYAGGFTPNPTYEEVCTGQTGHTEVVHIIYDPKKLSFKQLLNYFWENHNPTQGMRQGNDLGTQYRSAIYYYTEAQKVAAQESLAAYQALLSDSEFDRITTEILPAKEYYFAETYHQQYLAKNPNGYCGLGGTGICFPPSLQG